LQDTLDQDDQLVQPRLNRAWRIHEFGGRSGRRRGPTHPGQHAIVRDANECHPPDGPRCDALFQHRSRRFGCRGAALVSSTPVRLAANETSSVSAPPSKYCGQRHGTLIPDAAHNLGCVRKEIGCPTGVVMVGARDRVEPDATGHRTRGQRTSRREPGLHRRLDRG
jgi:hypothetical protein